MRPHIKDIILVWRPGRSHRRIPVAVIRSNAAGTTFQYIQKGVEEAREKGFVCFPDFSDSKDTHHVNVLKALSLRINDSERSDIQNYYDFWEVPEAARQDTYRLLALTQGILSTDNFEFLAEYYGVKGVRFVSELTGLTINKLDTGMIKDGDELEWVREPQNEYDNKAVALYKNGSMLGHVKKIHSRVFYLPGSESLKVKVKKVEHNGHINKAYILIYNSKDNF